MQFSKNKLLALIIPAAVVVVLDQISKHWIRTTPSLHDYSVIEGLLSFHYVQNPGMALGMRWFDTSVISVVAIIATILILVYIFVSLPKANKGYLICMGLILGGAFGNIIDRIFMARIGQYGTYLEGRVIDFIHFTLEIDDFAVFPYIFNVADMAISVSLILLLLFHNRLLPDRGYGKEDTGDSQPDSADINALGSDGKLGSDFQGSEEDVSVNYPTDQKPSENSSDADKKTQNIESTEIEADVNENDRVDSEQEDSKKS